MGVTSAIAPLVALAALVALVCGSCRFGTYCHGVGSDTGVAGIGGTAASNGPLPGQGGVGGNNIPLSIPDGGGFDFDPTPTETVNCGMTPYNLTRNLPDVLILLDRSASMIEHDVPGPDGQPVTRAEAAKVAMNTIVERTEANIMWGLKLFPEGNAEYCVVTDKVDVSLDINNYANMSRAINADDFDGDGTPTAAAVTSGARYLEGILDKHPKYLILTTDGEPSTDSKNQCTGDWAQPDVKTAAVNAVAAAANDGIKTYVIGVNASDTNAPRTTLNRLVQAGQTADPPIAPGEEITSSKNTTVHFYAADNYQGLVDSLSTITTQVSDCRFPLKGEPEVPDNVVVKVTDTDGQLVRVPQDSYHTNGWDYLGVKKNTIEVFGSWCEKVKAPTANNKVLIIFGCRGVIIP